ncbi:TetR family transcriptional regulator [Micromonospora arborensis]|uniref:TetR family transcriptional regulator n=1 Tax=Micromonospora arborensis TaxID=2116518 RepID=A0A318NA90_9ACTN|nr:TetR/AcrR family transcriptional regulator [Micromonospora arborensis]PYC63453.1 TetR family transcriptional regulator [Micromonospora arborensis]
MAQDGRTSEVPRTYEFLWRDTGQPGRAPGPKPGLSVDKIVGTAIAIADEEGLEAVSMQQIGKRLGVTAMSLYRYVPSKNHLVEAMFDDASGAPPDLTALSADWRAQVEAWVKALWARYQAHPWMVRAKVGYPIGPNQLAWFEDLLSAISRVGLRYEEMVSLALFLSGAAQGLARISIDRAPADESDPVTFGTALAAVADPARFPTLAALLAAGTFGPPPGTATGGGTDDAAVDDASVEPNLEFGLRQLLTGIEVYVTMAGRKR